MGRNYGMGSLEMESGCTRKILWELKDKNNTGIKF